MVIYDQHLLPKLIVWLQSIVCHGLAILSFQYEP